MLKTITKIAALAGFALTAYGFTVDGFGLFQSFALVVFFAWAYIYAAHHIEI
jgi:hypothetical protein